MKTLTDFLKVTLIGGLLVVLPVWLSLLLLLKAIKGVLGLLQPIAKLLPQRLSHTNVVAICLLVLICFAVGLLIRTRRGQRLGDWLEQHLLGRIPGFSLVRGMIQQFAGAKDEQSFQPALVEIEDALVPAFIIEKHADGQFTVFRFIKSNADGRRYLYPATRTRASCGRAPAQGSRLRDEVG